MRLCKKETGLYWFVHCVVWIGIALPTVFFLLRINHPRHDEIKTEPISPNNTHGEVKENVTSMAGHKRCRDYYQPRCSGIVDPLLIADEELEEFLNAISITKEHNSTCNTTLEKTLCIKKHLAYYYHCNNGSSGAAIAKLETQLVNETNKFCKTCYSYIKSNISLQKGRYNWLKNMSCISELLHKGTTEERNFSSCLHPLVKDENGTCRIPCDWSLMSPRLRDIYYAVMVFNFWAALITTVITLATLASFSKMREYPHIVRFYILICSAMYATSSLLPFRIGLAKVYCGKEQFWNEDGHSTIPTVIEGFISHYFFLAFCFWSLCYVVNAYSVIIRRAHKIFDKRCKYHLIQFSICSLLPALLVALNMAIKQPGYKSLFIDRMTSVFTSPVLEYVTFTLPVQVAIGISVSLLWSIIRFVRKVRQNNTTIQAVRPDDDIKGFIHAEHQFIKLAALFIATVAVVLSSEVVLTYRNEEYIHKVHEYFECLKTYDKNCPRPEVQIFFLSSVRICGPGIYCLLNFFLLFFNKDTRRVWRKWLQFGYSIVFCKRMEKDAEDTKTAERLTTTYTLNTNGSFNSLQRFSPNTICQSNTLTKAVHLNTLRSNSRPIAGSITPKEDCPLNINGDTS
ncbi:uncharacterized protein LOC114518430 [Dendronephthya gigantea]|uniref:uncharacterized protein LOC114518430 n=1 Tax=Dendronephthya gigantea TaxID=151771 RepID=UPI001068E6BB|nr:uncharacterized protein LOC114518430 [Dendronephthya gigantea]XP_028394340.1 uncharacterized protein LOC114518430 [Dendronephthya gigantea]XP_028394400.1 uncharacterized protein LOC114518430 [Dendronephthya gigantea]XP_028394451.1 uncharacterized protein LOC114518430 [Dendronephthya gigantea]XP_028394512.1 uncharacterized protein LOC114518430 [Dendronephthya gigantea]